MRRLFIVDLNGTLLHRLTRAHEVIAAKEHPKYRPAEFGVRGNPLYFRPFHYEFLKSLFDYGDVAIWTSARPKNAIPMVLRAFKGLLDIEAIKLLSSTIAEQVHRQKAVVDFVGSGTRTLKFLWTQEECDIIDSETSEITFRKDLDKVWMEFPEYNESNTVMVDDSMDKLRDHSENLLCIPEYLVTEASIDFTKDTALYGLSNYIKSMSMAEPNDVREYLKSHLFTSFEMEIIEKPIEHSS
jgi:hypothetical protein